MKKTAIKCFALSLFLLCSCGENGDKVTYSSDITNPTTSLSSNPIPSEIEPVLSVGLAYELNADGDGYIVKGKGTCIDKTINIPDAHLGLPVIEIAKEAFKDDSEITSFNSGKNIKRIGEGAFSSATALTSVRLNEGIETIEDEAFYWCHSLLNINLPSSLISIGQLAFFDSRLYRNNSNYVNGALIIDNWICYAQSVKGDLVVPSNVYGLSEKVFNNCSKLTSIDVPLSVTRYGQAPLFDFSDALTSIKISKNISLGSYVSSRFVIDEEFQETERLHYIRRG